ncbi:RNA polymerase sigma factor [Nocardioides sp.]|uniref:RNA polymerase sigma factor n=1 Tax=Nocardioides sp. TaxID=35761 RepID=UPI0035174F58
MSEPSRASTDGALASLVRESGRDVLATLVRRLGDLALAEDAVQEAVVRALQTWPRDGVPDNPTGWLRVVAQRQAIDLLRRERSRRRREEVRAMDPAFDTSDDAQDDAPDDGDDATLGDDLLRLLFTCCHPTLAPASRVALALRTLCGLTEPEIARALLSSPDAVAKRLVRARQKIKQARIPYRVPADHELPERWAAVLTTVYLLFNEGYSATEGEQLDRPELAEQAVRLGRLLVRLQPDDAAACGLLALMLLQHSRAAARTGPDGPLLLPEQDRSRWDRAAIEEAVVLVGTGLRLSSLRADRYVVQAAIAACHALAPSWEQTDWSAIVSWYDVLLTLDPSPVVALNRAVAVAERDGAEAGLVLIEAIGGLEDYALLHASRAALLRRLGRVDDAEAAAARAAALPLSEPVRARLGDL